MFWDQNNAIFSRQQWCFEQNNAIYNRELWCFNQNNAIFSRLQWCFEQNNAIYTRWQQWFNQNIIYSNVIILFKASLLSMYFYPLQKSLCSFTIQNLTLNNLLVYAVSLTPFFFFEWHTATQINTHYFR